MREKHVVKEGGEVALALLRLTHASADVFPPLKSATGGALHIAELVVKFKSNQAAWNSFGQYVRDALACVIGSLPDAAQPRDDLKQNMEKLRDTLNDILAEIKELHDKSLPKRIWSYTKDPEKILGMRQKLQDALSLFQLGSILTTGLDVSKVLKDIDIQHHLERVVNKLSGEIGNNLALDTLPYAAGASWDLFSVCLENTRVTLLEEIWNWIIKMDVSTTAEIFWLADVAGAGKSALAHTIAQRCYHQGLLASCFFFDREVEGRNGSKTLFSTIARDLANLNVALAEQICLAIERDRSLVTAPISRQFDKLIVGPSVRHSGSKPVVIVIDALDEGYTTYLLKILRDEVPKLPRNFRIFVTSRSEDEIDFYLSRQRHILRRTINIYGEENQADIASYVQFSLQDIATRKRLGGSWPGQELSDDFMRKADGLFLWVSTVSDYLRLSNNPANQLKMLLLGHNRSNIPAEAKMDRLYATILGTCNWNDVDFLTGYSLVMGAIIALKTPLSSSALQSLHPTLRVRDILGQFGSLIDGWMDDSHPIRIIHLSFRDFLTVRAQHSPDTLRFFVSEMEHSDRLALLCLLTLNQGFEQSIPGTGYLAGDTSEIGRIPKLTDNNISEVLWYACRFWIDHVIAVRVPESALIDALQGFLSAHTVHWVEIVTSKGQFLELHGVWKWILEALPEEHDLIVAVFNPNLAKSLDKLSSHLSGLGRREEALQAIKDAVALHQHLAEKNPTAFNPCLAGSLNNLSTCLSDLGQQGAALQAINDAVELYRYLAEDNPVAFKADLAMSLNNLSVCLSDLGQQEEALQAIKDAVTLRQHLAQEYPMAYKPSLASSLNHLSNQLSDLGQQEEALQAIKDAVELCQHLVEEYPIAYMPSLASSLNNLSNHLYDLGQREEALQAIKDAVDLYRHLAEDDPVTFKSDLASSLNNLSNCLSDLGQQEEALQAIKDAVELHKHLTEEHPIAFKLTLASSLNNLSTCLSDLGQQEEALQAIKDAVELCQHLAEEHPTVFNPCLAGSLNNLSNRLAALGHQEEALQTINDAVKLYQHLAEENPMAFNPDLAMSLNNLSNCLSALGQQHKALQAIRDAVKIYQHLAEEHPLAFNPDLAMSLNNLSSCLSALGHQEEALQVIKDAVQLRQKLAEDHPTAFNPCLARSLSNLSNCLSALGKQEEALQAIRDAVELHHHLAKDHPTTFNPDLVMSLINLSDCLFALGQQEEALQTIKNAIELYQQLTEEHLMSFNPDLAILLNDLSNYLSDLGQQGEPLQAIRDAVELFRHLTE